MAESEPEARRAVERYIKENFDSTCNLPYAGFGTDGYKLTVLDLPITAVGEATTSRQSLDQHR